MASILNQSLGIKNCEGGNVTLTVAFTTRQTPSRTSRVSFTEMTMQRPFFGVDSGDQLQGLKLFSTLLFNSSNAENIFQSIDFPFISSELDEDPWRQFFNTEDEIRSRMTISPFFENISSSVTAFTNTLPAQFGGSFSETQTA